MFRFSDRSRRELEGVHPDLVRLVERALELTTVDFIVWDGIRTEEEQAEYVRTGASKTMDSRHLHGLAVDLVPFVGKPRWEWPLCFQVAEAVRQAADALGQPIVWGGTWARLDGTIEHPQVLRARHSGWDGPHFELPRSFYLNNWLELAEAAEAAERAASAAQDVTEAASGTMTIQDPLASSKPLLEVYVPQPDVMIATGDGMPLHQGTGPAVGPDTRTDAPPPPRPNPAAIPEASADGPVDNPVDSEEDVEDPESFDPKAPVGISVDTGEDDQSRG